MAHFDADDVDLTTNPATMVTLWHAVDKNGRVLLFAPAPEVPDGYVLVVDFDSGKAEIKDASTGTVVKTLLATKSEHLFGELPVTTSDASPGKPCS